MRNYNIALVLLFALFAACSAPTKSHELKLVSFDTSIDCEGCKDKIMDSLPKEEGIVDVKVEVDEKVVTVVFNSSDLTVEKIAEKLNELGYSAFVLKLEDYSEHKIMND